MAADVKTHLTALQVGPFDVPFGFANLAATVDPGAGNDSTQGYAPGSIWLNTNSGVAWTNISAAVGAAVWSSGGGGGGGGTPFLSTTTSLSTSQILHLASAPVTFAAAPGVGKMILVYYISTQLKFGTVAFAFPNPAGTPNMYLGGLGGTMFADNIGSTLSQGASDVSTDVLGSQDFAVTLANTALTLIAPSEDSVNWGQVSAATLGVGGAGYAPGDTGSIVSGVSLVPATYVVDTVDGGGAVLTFHINNPGNIYNVSNGVATSVDTGGGDGNLTINITAITPGDGTGAVTVFYQLLTLL